MKPINQKKAVVFGERAVCIQCLECLITNAWTIVAVVSDDNTVVDWAKQAGITCQPFSSLHLVDGNYFYIFSIINPHIIPDSFLNGRNIYLGLNYHDSLLPKYAGVCSTTWSILNDEKTHGITIHKINSDIDSGDIAFQYTVEIGPAETAASLNLKCTEKFLSSFKQLIENTSLGSLHFRAQSLSHRSYYGLHHIPKNYAVINGVDDIHFLSRLFRALSFEEYINPIATVKAYLNGFFYILDKMTFLENEITFTTIKNIRGHLMPGMIVKDKDLTKPHMFNAAHLDYLSKIKALEPPAKEHLSRIMALGPSDNILKSDGTDDYRPLRIMFSIPAAISHSIFLSIIYFVLARYFREECIVSLYLDENSIPHTLLSLVEKRTFIFITKKLLMDSLLGIEQHMINVLENSKILVKDFFYRYKLRSDTDIGIVLGEISETDQHKLTVSMSDGCIIIQSRYEYQIQTNSLAECIKTAINQVNRLLNANLETVSILSNEPYHHVTSNQQSKETFSNSNCKTIHTWFEKQALRTPNNIAIVYNSDQLSYQTLNAKANQLANYLINSCHVKKNSCIVMFLDRSINMIIAMLAILKSGCAYVPIDIESPSERIFHMISDANPHIIITHKKHQSQFLDSHTLVLAMDASETLTVLESASTENPATDIAGNDLAYVIYTSGTTGKPNGVMIEHDGVVNLISHMITSLPLSEKSVVAQFSNYAFDASVYEIFPCLSCGGTLHILPNEMKYDSKKLLQYFEHNKINTSFIPTALVEELMSKLSNTSMKIIYTGGEKLDGLTTMPVGIKLINQYGLTETTVCATEMEVKDPNYIHIGKPIVHMQTYILDEKYNALPTGSIGELYIGGIGVARGYLNKPALTQERFIIHHKYGRLCKTCDLARQLPDGNIEYIGRNDSQVKIRGFRIELNEIVHATLSYTGMKQAIAIIKERDGEKYIVLYYISSSDLNEQRIVEHLSTKLPMYMIPSRLIRLDQFPLTRNNKIDIQKLPDPIPVVINDLAMSTGDLGDKIIAIWSMILNIKKESIRMDDHFFKLGGNSISIIKLKNGLSKLPEFKDISIANLFEYSTINKLIRFAQTTENHLRDDQKIIDQSDHVTARDTDIAILAISGAFSGCRDTDEYWNMIREGVEGIQQYTTETCLQLGVPREIIEDPCFVPYSGHVPDIDAFDPDFWDLAPAEARWLDPQIRQFLEHSWSVLQESGYAEKRQTTNIAVFAGSGNSDYPIQHISTWAGSRDFGRLSAKDALATKVAYLLGLTGTAANIATACSTSLVAVVAACKELTAGYCDMAIAGGVSLLMPEEVGHVYQEGMILSRDGHCRVFDAQASGIVHGSGVGTVLLKRLQDAQKDHDPILAVISGYATNNDGNQKMSYTAPSVAGQKKCILSAQKMAEISSDVISYVECHGTGTFLGDPVELHALREAFADNKKKNHDTKQPCMIGSVKANIGHADSAAGIAGLIKVCKMLEHQLIPQQINYSTLNPEINLGHHDFNIPHTTEAWQTQNHTKRIAGISSFGIGGTNAHVVVSEYRSHKNINNITTTKTLFPPNKKSYWINLGHVDDTHIFNRSHVAESNLSETHYKIAEIFSEVLGVEKISIYDDFFTLGGDSLLAVDLITKLQRHFSINLDDIFNAATIDSVAKTATLDDNNLRKKLEQVKSIYSNKKNLPLCDDEKMSKKRATYFEKIKNITYKNECKKIKNVMLTGSSGHLGCHILYQLLRTTKYKIYLPVRAISSHEAERKLHNKFKYYFDLNLKDYTSRITIFVSDCERYKLGLPNEQYAALAENIDGIIHSAALVKHYKGYDASYQANVQATINLLELSKLTHAKDFHYISTLAVLAEGSVPGCQYYVFDEYDDGHVITERSTVYAKTKYEGELCTIRYRQFGVHSNIYRLGNVAMDSISGRHQENISDNGFFMRLKTMLDIGMIPQEFCDVEISPVDYTARAIVNIFDKIDLSNETYHVFNPYRCNLMTLMGDKQNICVRMSSLGEFIDNILIKLDTNTDIQQIELFMLHQKWLHDIKLSHSAEISILQDKTNMILSHLNFIWPRITWHMISKMVEQALPNGSIYVAKTKNI